MVKKIDVRGLTCPQPVMLVKKAIDAGEHEIVVMANDEVAVGNVQRLAQNNGFTVEIERQQDEKLIKLKR